MDKLKLPPLGFIFTFFIAPLLVMAAVSYADKSDKSYSLKELKGTVCWAICRQDGYDAGLYEDKSDTCLCGNRKPFKKFTGVSIKIKSPLFTSQEPEEEE